MLFFHTHLPHGFGSRDAQKPEEPEEPVPQSKPPTTGWFKNGVSQGSQEVRTKTINQPAQSFPYSNRLACSRAPSSTTCGPAQSLEPTTPPPRGIDGTSETWWERRWRGAGTIKALGMPNNITRTFGFKWNVSQRVEVRYSTWVRGEVGQHSCGDAEMGAPTSTAK